ncbi:hypothetical protein CC80DRAFT_126642 [Byssothecium circinans]|uniref:Uncharacterized protein n=1 Tax=Byssothecium circinans TaxID=147558 RepID=A0A6A5TQD2_9PLEO|nr:hypothetical protein CC80DRAFT_126642 [Byssothecium circinans]
MLIKRRSGGGRWGRWRRTRRGNGGCAVGICRVHCQRGRRTGRACSRWDSDTTQHNAAAAAWLRRSRQTSGRPPQRVGQWLAQRLDGELLTHCERRTADAGNMLSRERLLEYQRHGQQSPMVGAMGLAVGDGKTNGGATRAAAKTWRNIVKLWRRGSSTYQLVRYAC